MSLMILMKSLAVSPIGWNVVKSTLTHEQTYWFKLKDFNNFNESVTVGMSTLIWLFE